MIEKLTAALAWLGLLAVVAGCLQPVWGDWSGTVCAPFGGTDAMLQLGLLEWSARTWTEPALWLQLPIFHPVPGALGFMDSLLGQAWLTAPVRALLHPTAAALYNWAFLGSLLLAAVAMATLWLAAGGARWSAGVAALFLVGAPYTLSQLAHLNQLPPPFALFALAATVYALRRRRAGFSELPYWCLAAASLVLQAAWGWYGFAFAVIGMTALVLNWLIHRLRRGDRPGRLLLGLLLRAGLPLLLAAGGVLLLAQPQLRLAQRYDGFTRSDAEVRFSSADLQHFLNRGVYRSGPADWLGRGVTGDARWQGRDRQVLHPGWLALGLAAAGWWRRGYLPFGRRRVGRGLLAMGLVGLVLAFGDSLGLPLTDRRLPLPLDVLREIVPPFKAFRGAWRFAWLMTIAMAWWSAVGAEQLAVRFRAARRLRWVLPGIVVLGTLLALPAALPGRRVPLDGRPLPAAVAAAGPILTLPAPADEFAEDPVEALWLTRALVTGQAVTGGASGWVPPEVAARRLRMLDCEAGRLEAADWLREQAAVGLPLAELVLRPGDEGRIAFWRGALQRCGAVRLDPWPHPDYETWRLP